VVTGVNLIKVDRVVNVGPHVVIMLAMVVEPLHSEWEDIDENSYHSNSLVTPVLVYSVCAYLCVCGVLCVVCRT